MDRVLGKREEVLQLNLRHLDRVNDERSVLLKLQWNAIDSHFSPAVHSCRECRVLDVIVIENKFRAFGAT